MGMERFMYKRLGIIGARGHGKVVADVAKASGLYQELFFLDDDPDLTESIGIPVIGNSEAAFGYISSCDLFVAIGNAQTRKELVDKLCYVGAKLPVLIHPKATVASSAIVDSGTVIMAGAVVNPDARIGKGCIINTCASVDHDCIVEDYTHVAVGAHLAGNVHVGKNTWIGAGVIVKNNIEICEDCMIGAGAVVVKNIYNAGVYVGVPAKRQRESRRTIGGGAEIPSIKPI